MNAQKAATVRSCALFIGLCGAADLPECSLFLKRSYHILFRWLFLGEVRILFSLKGWREYIGNFVNHV